MYVCTHNQRVRKKLKFNLSVYLDHEEAIHLPYKDQRNPVISRPESNLDSKGENKKIVPSRILSPTGLAWIRIATFGSPMLTVTHLPAIFFFRQRDRVLNRLICWLIRVYR